MRASAYPPLGARILLWGCGGKSTLARSLSDKLQLPRGQLFTRTTHVGTGSEALLAGLEDARNKTVCILRAIPGDILPNFGKVSLC